ncbi:MAG: carbohydrate ABC transporter permease [Actinobacteria bacterium]|nr:carbohydrate ABC transporter permease [Actinomycetota bacterium]
MSTLDTARLAPAPLPVDTKKRPRGALAGRWWLYVLLLLGLLAVVGPFLWMFLASIKSQEELLRAPPTWVPESPSLSNYDRLFDRLDFPRYFWNSTFIAGMITLANLVFCSMVGYALAKLRFAGRDKIFLLVLGTLLVPGAVTLVPLFVLMSKLNLVDTPWAVILPVAAGPLGVFLMRQFMQEIPDDLLEAARVDGAGEVRIFTRIVIPLSVPALAALGIVTFLPAWNALLWPLVVLTGEENYTLPVALAIFARGQFQADYGLLMAGSVVLVVPVIIVFLLLQRRFTQSVAHTGLKG